MARKSRKNQTAAPVCDTSIYIRTALYIRLSVEDNKKRGYSIGNQMCIRDRLLYCL